MFPYIMLHSLVREKAMYDFATYYVSSYCNNLFLELASHVLTPRRLSFAVCKPSLSHGAC